MLVTVVPSMSVCVFYPVSRCKTICAGDFEQHRTQWQTSTVEDAAYPGSQNCSCSLARFTVQKSTTIAGALQSVPQHQDSWPGDSEYARKETKKKGRERSDRGRRGAVGDPLQNRRPYSSSTLRAAIDCLTFVPSTRKRAGTHPTTE